MISKLLSVFVLAGALVTPTTAQTPPPPAPPPAPAPWPEPDIVGDWSIPGLEDRDGNPLEAGVTITELPNGEFKGDVWVVINGDRHVIESEQITFFLMLEEPDVYGWENPNEDDPEQSGLGWMYWDFTKGCWISEVLAGPNEGEVRELHPINSD